MLANPWWIDLYARAEALLTFCPHAWDPLAAAKVAAFKATRRHPATGFCEQRRSAQSAACV